MISPETDLYEQDYQLRQAITRTSQEAPRVDLWPRLAEEARTLATAQQRRHRRAIVFGRLWTVTGAMLTLAMIAAVALGFWAVVKHRADRLAISGQLSDTVLILRYTSAPGAPIQTLAALQPATQQEQVVLDGAGKPVIAADGRQLFITQSVQSGTTIDTGIVALKSDTLAQQWRKSINAAPAADARQHPLNLSVTVVDDRVYVTMYRWDGTQAGQLTLITLDRATGEERGRRTFTFNDKALNTVNVFPYGTQSLVLFVGTAKPTTSGAVQTEQQMQMLRLRLPDGAELSREPITAPGTSLPYYTGGMRLLTDGRTLYGLRNQNDSAGLVLQFFDLATGTFLPALPLGLKAPDGYLPTQQGISDDGNHLYIIAPTSGELVVIDLQARTIERRGKLDLTLAPGTKEPSFGERIWRALRGLVAQEASAKYYYTGSLQISPGGRWLYAAGIQGTSYEAVPQGVFVIDLTTLTVADRWLPEKEVGGLLLDNAGQHLFVQTIVENSGETGLLALDTTTGQTTFSISSPKDQRISQAFTLSELYREQYGRSPAANSTRRPPEIKPVAAIQATFANTAVLTGDTVTITAQFVDPATKQVVVAGQNGPRYDPPSTVQAVLCRSSNCAENIPVTLAPDGYATFRGSTVVTTPGEWSLRVTMTWPDGSIRVAGGLSTLNAQQAFQGTDGGRYRLQVNTTPAQPVGGQPAQVRVAFVNVATGAPIPAGVTIQDNQLSGLPETIEIAFFSNAGVISRDFAPDGYGSYSTIIDFVHGTTWTMRASFLNRQGIAVTLEIGSLKVAGP